MFVSVITPTYNRQASLARLLRGLAEQTYPHDQFELVVVDDGSDDGTVDYLRSVAVPFRLRVAQQRHAGPAVARNLGVAEATGQLVLFLDDDVWPTPTLLDEHVRAHTEADNRRVVVGPMLPPGDWKRSAWIKWDEQTLAQQYRAMLAGEWGCGPRQFYTANASVHRGRFLAAGGFDPGFKRAEDVELAFRLHARGAQFVFNPRAEILHFASRTFRAWRQTAYQYGRYDVLMQRDRGQPTLENAFSEFHARHPLNRGLIRACLGRPWLGAAATMVLSAVVLTADAVGLERVARWALSGIFGVRYWNGVCDEVGSAPRVAQSISAHRASTVAAGA